MLYSYGAGDPTSIQFGYLVQSASNIHPHCDFMNLHQYLLFTSTALMYVRS